MENLDLLCVESNPISFLPRAFYLTLSQNTTGLWLVMADDTAITADMFQNLTTICKTATAVSPILS